MPQAYLVLHDDMGNYLITKKRIQNRWWDGVLGATAVCNQAGQYGLPGGRMKHGESATAAALREFREETGIDLVAEDPNIVGERIAGTGYFVVDVDVSKVKLQDILVRANAHLRPSAANAEIPTGPGVRDWEHSLFKMVPGADIRSYLGVRLYIIPAHRTAVAARPAHSQLIDWYRDIANYIYDLCV